jgi:hypothetical protein
MNTTEKRLGLALLVTAAVIIINVYMVVTGAAGDFYDHWNGAAPQHAAQVPFKEYKIHVRRVPETACQSIRADSCRIT